MTVHPILCGIVCGIAAAIIAVPYGQHWACLAALIAFIWGTVWMKGRQ